MKQVYTYPPELLLAVRKSQIEIACMPQQDEIVRNIFSHVVLETRNISTPVETNSKKSSNSPQQATDMPSESYITSKGVQRRRSNVGQSIIRKINTSPDLELLHKTRERLVELVKDTKDQRVYLHQILSLYCKKYNEMLNPVNIGYPDVLQLVSSAWPSLKVVPVETLEPKRIESKTDDEKPSEINYRETSVCSSLDDLDSGEKWMVQYSSELQPLNAHLLVYLLASLLNEQASVNDGVSLPTLPCLWKEKFPELVELRLFQTASNTRDLCTFLESSTEIELVCQDHDIQIRLKSDVEVPDVPMYIPTKLRRNSTEQAKKSPTAQQYPEAAVPSMQRLPNSDMRNPFAQEFQPQLPYNEPLNAKCVPNADPLNHPYRHRQDLQDTLMRCLMNQNAPQQQNIQNIVEMLMEYCSNNDQSLPNRFQTDSQLEKMPFSNKIEIPVKKPTYQPIPKIKPNDTRAIMLLRDLLKQYKNKESSKSDALESQQRALFSQVYDIIQQYCMDQKQRWNRGDDILEIAVHLTMRYHQRENSKITQERAYTSMSNTSASSASDTNPNSPQCNSHQPIVHDVKHTLLELLAMPQLNKVRHVYRMNNLGIPIRRLKKFWNQKLGDSLTARMQSVGIAKVFMLLSKIPNIVIFGEGGNARVMTVLHAKEMRDSDKQFTVKTENPNNGVYNNLGNSANHIEANKPAATMSEKDKSKEHYNSLIRAVVQQLKENSKIKNTFKDFQPEKNMRPMHAPTEDSSNSWQDEEISTEHKRPNCDPVMCFTSNPNEMPSDKSRPNPILQNINCEILEKLLQHTAQKDNSNHSNPKRKPVSHDMETQWSHNSDNDQTQAHGRAERAMADVERRARSLLKVIDLLKKTSINGESNSENQATSVEYSPGESYEHKRLKKKALHSEVHRQDSKPYAQPSEKFSMSLNELLKNMELSSLKKNNPMNISPNAFNSNMGLNSAKEISTGSSQHISGSNIENKTF